MGNKLTKFANNTR